MHTGWSFAWQAFHDTLVHEPVAIQLVVWVGLALILVLALEGLRVSLAPSRFIHRHLHLAAHRQPRPAEPSQRSEPVQRAEPPAKRPPQRAAPPRPRRVRVVIKKKSVAAKPLRRRDP